MATRANEVFDFAMALMDETNPSDQAEYRTRALPILNMLRHELYPYSDTFSADDEGRPISTRIKSMESVIDLDDYLAQDCMPYGLAARLLITEDPATANNFEQLYKEAIANASRGRPAVFEDIEDVVFGGSDYSEFGMWG